MVVIPPGRAVLSKLELVNSTCHCFFHDREQSRVFVRMVAGNTVVIPCLSARHWDGVRGVTRLGPQLQGFGDLVAYLDDIAGGHVSLDVVMATLVVDNISAFYWDLRVADSDNYRSLGLNEFVLAAKWYTRLVEVVLRILARYKCNVIVTSYDVSFDRGYDQKNERKHHSQDNDTMAAVSYLPESYLLRFDHLVHMESGMVREYNRRSRKWEMLGEIS